MLREACNEALSHHKSDVLILAGAVLSGMDEILQEEFQVPVIDPVKCAVAAAEGLVRMRLTHNHDLYFSAGEKDFRSGLKHLPDAYR